MPDLKLPDLGENIAAGDVVSLLVKEGDIVKPQQDVIEIETEKAVIPVPSSLGGRVAKIHVKPGQTVKVGQVLLSLEEAAIAATKPPAVAGKPGAKADSSAKGAPKPAPSKPSPAKAEAPKEKPRPAAAPTAERSTGSVASTRDNGHPPEPAPLRSAPPAAAPEPEDDVPATSPAAAAGPAVRRLARELGVELTRVRGTGPDGRILREDVIAAVRHATGSVTTTAPQAGAQERDAWGLIRREPLAKMRKTIAANMVLSAFTIPHLTNFDDADITELERIRKGSVADYAGSNVKLTSLVFVMKAVGLALRQHPMLNASLDMENNQIIYKDYVNLGIAVDTPRGLVVPVVRDVDKLTISHVAQAKTASTIAEKKATQYTIDDLRGGSVHDQQPRSDSAAPTRRRSSISPKSRSCSSAARTQNAGRRRRPDRLPRLMMPLSLSYDRFAWSTKRRRRARFLERSDRLSAIAGDVAAGAVNCFRRISMG